MQGTRRWDELIEWPLCHHDRRHLIASPVHVVGRRWRKHHDEGAARASVWAGQPSARLREERAPSVLHSRWLHVRRSLVQLEELRVDADEQGRRSPQKSKAVVGGGEAQQQCGARGVWQVACRSVERTDSDPVATKRQAQELCRGIPGRRARAEREVHIVHVVPIRLVRRHESAAARSRKRSKLGHRHQLVERRAILDQDES